MKTQLALLMLHESPLMTGQQVAALFGIEMRTLENQIYAKTCPVPMFKLGSKWFANVVDVAQYIDAQRDAAVKELNDAGFLPEFVCTT